LIGPLVTVGVWFGVGGVVHSSASTIDPVGGVRHEPRDRRVVEARRGAGDVGVDAEAAVRAVVGDVPLEHARVGRARSGEGGRLVAELRAGDEARSDAVAGGEAHDDARVLVVVVAAGGEQHLPLREAAGAAHRAVRDHNGGRALRDDLAPLAARDRVDQERVEDPHRVA
jgi:hypothetical protein